MCREPTDYLGLDRLLGLCKCRTDNLNEICDEECRAAQRNRLQWFCPETPLPSFIRITGSAGDIQVRAAACKL